MQKWGPPPPKATWSSGVRAGVEAVGIGEVALVAVGRGVGEQDLVARSDPLAPELVVLGGGAPERHDGPRHRSSSSTTGGGHSAPPSHGSKIDGSSIQAVHRLGHGVGRRAEAPDEHGREEGHDLEVAQAVDLAVLDQLGAHQIDHDAAVGVGIGPYRRP